jgi:L-alanine-DL-glutamate epimerase-like enolase superfamily enzyme
VTTFEKLASLPLVVERYELEDRRKVLANGFTRATTTIHLLGDGEEGLGEDVVYAPEDHDAMQAAGPVQPLAGEWTLGAFCAHVGGLQLFPKPPEYEASDLYRRWAFESAALDLALRQAGTSLHAHLGITPRPLTFVNSLGLGEPPTLEPVRARLERYPSLRLKLDARSTWTDEIFDELAQGGAVDSVDLKGFYRGTPVDQPADPVLYRKVAERFPTAWIEDPWLTDETRPILEPHKDRLTWDAPIHGLADLETLPWPPRMVNVKPSRVGSLQELCTMYDTCAARGIGMYGGGQGELSVGRGQIQLLAALFHPDTPNDVAPRPYNDDVPPPGLPDSPLDPDPAPTGFRRAEDD